MKKPKPRTLADTLNAERARLFVGRAAELHELEALLDPTSARRVISLWAPGGAGKTELLAAFVRRARARGVPTLTLVGEELQASESSFRAVMLERLGTLADDADGDAVGHAVVIVDRFELLASLETWIRERLLPSLDGRLRFVLAGRLAPSVAWAKHPAWRTIHTPLALGDLAATEAGDYLTRRGVPVARHAEVIAAANGHPLALALIADVVEHDPDAATSLGQHPETVRILLGALIDSVPDDLHRDALWSMALLRRTTEEALAATVDGRRARTLFSYLERLSFVRVTSDGLAPHDLVRELLCVDLDWRFPGRREALLERAARHLLGRLEREPALGAKTFADINFLWRHAMPAVGYANDGLYVSAPRHEDLPLLRAWVARHHGPSAAELFDLWLEHGDVVVVRGPDELPKAMAVQAPIARLDLGALARDPAIAPLRDHPELVPEGALFVRWVLDAEHGEGPSATSAVLHRWEFETYIETETVTRGISVWRDPNLGLINMPPGMLVVEPELTFELDGHRYATIRTNDGGQPLLGWFIRGLFGALIQRPSHSPELDRDAFATAVRDALKHVRHPEQLATSPLLTTPLVSEAARRSGSLDAVRELTAVLESSLEQLHGDELDRRLVRATYFSPRAKQEGVAADLGLPFGTYRKRLAASTTRIAQWLWLLAGFA